MLLRCLVCLLGAFSVQLLAAQERPNIIVIFTDDQVYRAIGYNNPVVKTPHLDRLAGEGLIFDKAYVASPICAASRASMMTGVFPQQHGVIALNTKGFQAYIAGGDKSGLSLASQMANAGYHCAFWGKSHIGAPQRYGFHEGKETGPFDDVETFRLAEAFLDRAALDEKPFFLWVAPRQPHVPLNPKQQWLDLYDETSLELDSNFRVEPIAESVFNQGKPGQNFYRDSRYKKNWKKLTAGPPRDEATMRLFIKAYYAAISHLDHQVGQLVARLGSHGLADKTTILFLSDNGYHLGNHGLGNKITMHEESVRVPMFITGAGVSAVGQRTQALVSSLDVYPTLLALAGAEAPAGVMGESLLPVLSDPSATVREFVFSECTGVGAGRGAGHRMARGADWKYVLTDTNEHYWFDQQTDPFELNNLFTQLSPEQAPQVERYQQALSAWMQSIGDRDFPEP